MVIYFPFFFFFLCLGGIIDSPEQLLTVILAPGADIDSQQDIPFLLFISSSLRDAAECKSAFSPWEGGGELQENSGGKMLGWDGGAADLKTWWKRAAGTDGGVGGVIGHAREVCCARPSNALVLFAVSFPLWCVCVYLNLQHTENQTTLLAK